MTHKIAHIADIHFRGYKRHAEYRQIMEQFFSSCRDEKIDAFVISGDIVHSKTQNITPELIEMLTWWFNQMSQIAPVHVTLGNHDGLLTNLTRQDTITPVISAINSDRIFLYKKSGVYPILGNACDLVVFSPFDEDRWDEVKNIPLDRNFSIATFHGAIAGCVSDSGWALSTDADVSYFEKYDFAMLGDIHKRQNLDIEGRVAYPGSMIQQNFGEDKEKGFLLWEISSRNEWKKKFIELSPVQPYVTIDWKGDFLTSVNSANLSAEDLKNARVRIRSEVPLSQVKTRDLAKKLKDAFDTHEVYFKHKSVRRETSTEVESAVMTVERDPRSLAKMVVDFGYVEPESEVIIDKMIEIIKSTSKKILPTEVSGGKTWSLGKMEWDNTYGYGSDNYIDFSNMSGLVGIFGQNRVGKSSIPATVLYTLFNASDRGLTKNSDIVNVRKDYCRSKIDFHVGSDRYVAERQTIKKTNKREVVTAATYLNLACIDDKNTVHADMNGEQRRDTDRELKSLIGTVDDFVLTAFATQGDGNNFVSAKPIARQEILARFLQLDFFSNMHECFRDTSSGIRRAMSDAQSNLSLSNPHLLATEIRELKTERDSIQSKIIDAREEIEKAQSEIDPDRKNILNAIEKRSELSLKVIELEKSIEVNTEILDNALANQLETTQSIEVNRVCRSEINDNSLRKTLESFISLSTSLEKFTAIVTAKKQYYDNLKKSVNLLKKVPCGDTFPTCRFIKESHKSKGKMEEASIELKEARSSLRAIKRAMSAIDADQIRKCLQDARLLDEKHLELERLSVKKENELSTAQFEKISLEKNLETFCDELQLLEARWDFDSVDERDDPIISISRLVSELEQKDQKCSEMIGSKIQEARHLKDLSETVTSLRIEHDTYEVLMRSFSKSGIPSHLVTASLPVINKKLSEVLFENCGFTIELESDEGSKRLDIYIDYGDSRRKIECASGMEKMIASLSLRTALHTVTHLPKPDFMILDEGFGALDDSSVEISMKMLRSMLDHFRFILIISHVETVKESVDEMIEVSRDGLNSRVQHG